MADDDHISQLRRGVDAWNAWREENSHISPDLSGANLRHANLRGAHLHWAWLNGAKSRRGEP